jgi:hypothetical protein
MYTWLCLKLLKSSEWWILSYITQYSPFFEKGFNNSGKEEKDWIKKSCPCRDFLYPCLVSATLLRHSQ